MSENIPEDKQPSIPLLGLVSNLDKQTKNSVLIIIATVIFVSAFALINTNSPSPENEASNIIIPTEEESIVETEDN